MVKTKLFKNGSNQAIRIPKKWSFDCDEVMIIRRGDELIVRPGQDDWAELQKLAADFSPDFMASRPKDLMPDEVVRFE